MLLRGYMHTAILWGGLGHGDIIDRVMVGSGTSLGSRSHIWREHRSLK
jgi:hypothetical protein